MGTKVPRVGIQIITSRSYYLGNLLTSLMFQTYKKFDLIIVYQNDEIIQNHMVISNLDRMKYMGHRVKLIKADPALGIGALRNIALENDTNPIGCRIDDDSFVDSRYLEFLLNCLLNEPKAGCVGGIVPLMASEKLYAPVPDDFNKISEFYDMTDDCINFYNVEENCYFPSGHLRSSFMYWNKIAKQIKFPTYNDDIAGWREESDFCIRVGKAGYQNFIVPNAIAFHYAAPYLGTRTHWSKSSWKDQLLAEQKFKEEISK